MGYFWLLFYDTKSFVNLEELKVQYSMRVKGECLKTELYEEKCKKKKKKKCFLCPFNSLKPNKIVNLYQIKQQIPQLQSSNFRDLLEKKTINYQSRFIFSPSRFPWTICPVLPPPAASHCLFSWLFCPFLFPLLAFVIFFLNNACAHTLR